MATSASQWIRAFCEEIGSETPTDEQMDAVLRLASVAAHSSERIAAPISCWIAGRTGRPLEELIAIAERLERF